MPHISSFLSKRYSHHALISPEEAGGGGARGQSHVAHLGHGLEAGELRGVALHELDRVPVGQVLERLDDLGVLVVVLAEQARLDVLRVEVLVHVTHSVTNVKIIKSV